MIWDMPLLEGNMFFLNTTSIVHFCEYLYSRTLRPWCLTLVPQLNWVGSIANCGSNSNYWPMQCVGTGCLTWCYLNKCLPWESSFITFLELVTPSCVMLIHFHLSWQSVTFTEIMLKFWDSLGSTKPKITKTPQTEKLNLISNPLGSFSSRRSQGIDLCPESFSHLFRILCFRNTCCCGGSSPGCWNLEYLRLLQKLQQKPSTFLDSSMEAYNSRLPWN